LEISAVDKPAGVWCRHFDKAARCGIYATRPNACRQYQCAWTLEQRFDETWRPDVARFVMNVKPGELTIVADPSHPNAWKREPYGPRLLALAARNRRPFTVVLLFVGPRVSVVFPEGEIALGPNQPDMAIDSGYDTAGAPYARFVAPDAARTPG
jgi:hypothetical protein